MESHELYVAVFHDATGNIHYVMAFVLGPKGTDDEIDTLYAETSNALLTTLGATDSEAMRTHVELGIIRTRMDCSYTFVLDSIYCSMTPTQPADEGCILFTPKKGNIQRNVAMNPVHGRPGPKPQEIPGLSVTELEELLDGFTVQLKVDEQVLYGRESETHTDFVQCTVHDGGKVSRVEAFAGKVIDDANLDELNHRLWDLLADISYKEANPQKAKAFITSPKLPHPSGWGANVGYAHFSLPISPNGRYRHLNVWAIKPDERFLIARIFGLCDIASASLPKPGKFNGNVRRTPRFAKPRRIAVLSGCVRLRLDRYRPAANGARRRQMAAGRRLDQEQPIITVR